jgi:hypothetical protein
MVTQTGERTQDKVREAKMNTMAVEPESKSRMVYLKPFIPLELEQLTQEADSMPAAEVLTPVAGPAHQDGLLGKHARRIVAFYLWLSGPAMTERARSQRKLTEAEHERWRFYSSRRGSVEDSQDRIYIRQFHSDRQEVSPAFYE